MDGEIALYVVLEVLRLVFEVLCACAPLVKVPQRPLPTDSDDWKCPDSAEIARVLGRGSVSPDRDRGMITVPCELLKSGHSDDERAPGLQGPGPLWDRELDG
jgi:hypothetical protein